MILSPFAHAETADEHGLLRVVIFIGKRIDEFFILFLEDRVVRIRGPVMARLRTKGEIEIPSSRGMGLPVRCQISGGISTVLGIHLLLDEVRGTVGIGVAAVCLQCEGEFQSALLRPLLEESETFCQRIFVLVNSVLPDIYALLRIEVSP